MSDDDNKLHIVYLALSQHSAIRLRPHQKKLPQMPGVSGMSITYSYNSARILLDRSPGKTLLISPDIVYDGDTLRSVSNLRAMVGAEGGGRVSHCIAPTHNKDNVDLVVPNDPEHFHSPDRFYQDLVAPFVNSKDVDEAKAAG